MREKGPDLDHLAVAIRALTGKPVEESRAVARRVLGAQARVRRLAARGYARSKLFPLRSLPCRVDASALDELEVQPRPFLLALPLTLDTVALLARYVRGTRRHVCLELTPLTEAALAPLTAAGGAGGVELLSPGAMIRRNRSRWSEKGPDFTTYVSFPDHHYTRDGTCRPVTFFGQDHLFPVLEPLLFFRGVAPVLTLGPGGGRPLRFQLFTYDGAAPEGPATEADAKALLAFLARDLEAVIVEAPDAVLSFGQAAERSRRTLTVRKALERNLVEGFLRAWHLSDPRFDAPLLAWCLSQLPQAAAPAPRVSRAQEA